MSTDPDTELRAELASTRAAFALYRKAARWAVAEAYAYGFDVGERGIDEDFDADDHLRKMCGEFPGTTLDDLEALMPICRLHTDQVPASPAAVAETVARLWRDAMVKIGEYVVTIEHLRAENERLRRDRLLGVDPNSQDV